MRIELLITPSSAAPKPVRVREQAMEGETGETKRATTEKQEVKLPASGVYTFTLDTSSEPKMESTWNREYWSTLHGDVGPRVIRFASVPTAPTAKDTKQEKDKEVQ